jgi:ClpP class serine protease
LFVVVKFYSEFQTVTAGKFKRTLTPTKKVTKEDMKKSAEDIESIFNLFKGWVAQNRPQLNIDEVATGETWFGTDAMERGLCDAIATVDDILLDYVDRAFNVYEVKYAPPPEVPSSLSFLFASDDNVPSVGDGSSFGRRAIRWLVRTFTDEVQAVLSEPSPFKERYMAKDDTAGRVKASSDDF